MKQTWNENWLQNHVKDYLKHQQYINNGGKDVPGSKWSKINWTFERNAIMQTLQRKQEYFVNNLFRPCIIDELNLRIVPIKITDGGGTYTLEKHEITPTGTKSINRKVNHIDTEKIFTTSIIELSKTNDNKCDRLYNIIWNLEYNNIDEKKIYEKQKDKYNTYKENGILSKVEPYIAFLDNEFIININNECKNNGKFISAGLPIIIGCNLSHIVEQGTPMNKFPRNEKEFNTEENIFWVAIIRNLFTFKCQIRREDETGMISYYGKRMRRRNSSNAYSTRSNIYNNM